MIPAQINQNSSFQMICFHLLVLPRSARKRKSTKIPRSKWSVFTYLCFRALRVRASPPRFLTVKSLFSATCQILNPYSEAHLCYRARRGSASDHTHGASTGCHLARTCAMDGVACARRRSASGIWSTGSQVDENPMHCCTAFNKPPPTPLPPRPSLKKLEAPQSRGSHPPASDP